jgi:hypothetical protein
MSKSRWKVRYSIGVPLACVLATAGCANAPSSSTAALAGPSSAVAGQNPNGAMPAKTGGPAKPVGNPFASPTSATEINYGTGLKTRPAPRNAVAAVAASRARSIAATHAIKSLASVTPIATLRLVDLDPSMGSASGPSVNVVRNRLAWVMTYPNSEPQIYGPANLTATDRKALAAKTECIFLVVVDASSGAPVDSEQVCRPKQGQ